MVNEEINKRATQDFAFCLRYPQILGVILFGSYATGENHAKSDIDICIVAPHQELIKVYNLIMENLTRPQDYEFRIFEELPLYIQGEIIEKGRILLTLNRLDLMEYFYLYRRRWNDQKLKLKLLNN